MEFFTKTNAVKLRSHLEKYLIADDDGEKVRQSRNSTSRKAIWFVEIVEPRKETIRLRNFNGRYLLASDLPFLLGATGKRVLQSWPDNIDWKLDWEPIRDGFQVKLRSWCGKYLRANGGTPPWRNSITHDEPHTGATQKWILWDVEAVDETQTELSVVEYLSSMSSFTSVAEDVLEAMSDEPESPISSVSMRSPRLTVVKSMSPRLMSPRLSYSNQFRSGMELFRNAKAVRLRSTHHKYLLADGDEETVTQHRKGSSKAAKWIVEPVPESDTIIRLKSVYNKYLTASNQPFLLGMTGKKVLQTRPKRLDSSVEWEPIREGNRVKLRTRYGNFLRANGGLPPWRNSVTHDIPSRTVTQDWILWEVDVVEIQVKSPADEHHRLSDSLDAELSESPSSVSAKSDNFSRQESTGSNGSSPQKPDGRTVYYHVADESSVDDGDDVLECSSLNFKGNEVDELTRKLKEETGLQDIVVCTRSVLNGKLYPLRLQLPPNNADMHVVVVELSSKVISSFEKHGVAL